MVIIKNLFHGTNQHFNMFNDMYIGNGAGTGNIAAHWLAKGGKNPERAAKLYAEKFGLSTQHYIYKVSLEIEPNAVVKSVDNMYDKLNEDQIVFLKDASSKINNYMTFENFIQENENANILLINIGIVVITMWPSDNGQCAEYISVLTSERPDLCSINLNLV